MSNQSIIARLRDIGVRYGLAIEVAPAGWHELINDVEGRLELIRFTVEGLSQRDAALLELSRVRDAAEALS